MLTFAGKKADMVSEPQLLDDLLGGRPPRKRPDEAVADQIGWIWAGAGGRFNDIEISTEVRTPAHGDGTPTGRAGPVGGINGSPSEQVMADPENLGGIYAGVLPIPPEPPRTLRRFPPGGL